MANRRAQPGAPAQLFESKLHPPSTRSGFVARTAIVEKLNATSDVPIVSVAAPPGYGKTTLLAEWARSKPDAFAWVSADHHDNDLSVLLSNIAAALERAEPVDPALLRRSIRARSVAGAASNVAAAMASMHEGVVLVLDNVESIQDQSCLDTVAELALHLPRGARLVLATRAEPPLPMPRLRASRDIVEVGVDDLAMNEGEARILLGSAGVQLGESEMEQVLERTEGWPVGLYLAALALKSGESHDRAGISFSEDDRLVADYLRSELLGELSPAELTFLTRTSVLERMSGQLCDTVLDATGSAEMLESLARSNHLLVALDRQDEWYRYHHLLHAVLKAELVRREPDLVAQLHVRASEWYEKNGLQDMAIDHARAAGDADRVNRLFLAPAGQRLYATGRAESVRRLLQWLEEHGPIERYPAAAALGALFFGRIGDASAAERWAAAAEQPTGGRILFDRTTTAEQAAHDRILPDGSTLEGLLAFMRTALCRNGPAAMRDDSERALEGLNAGSGFRGAALLFGAISYVLDGDTEHADPMLAHAADVGLRSNAIPTVVVALAERGMLAINGNNWSQARRFINDALSLVQEWSLEDYSEAALVYVLAASVGLHGHAVGAARNDVARAARLRPLLSYANPVLSVQTLMQLASVYIELSDTAGAHEVLRQADDVMRQRPDLGNLGKQLDAVASKVEAMRTGNIGASSLTTAELRLVPFLATHLTLGQIAARLHLSRNTVKSEAISVYQKLGVTSRHDAIERLQQVGLINE